MAKTRQEAARRLAEAIRDRDKGLIVLPERESVAHFLMRWLDDVRGQVKTSSHRRYGDYVRVHLVPTIGQIPLVRLTPAHVQTLMTRKLAEGLHPTTVRSMRTVLHRALEDAERQGLVQRNVSEQARPPRQVRANIQTMTEEQAAAFLSAAEGARFHALFVLALTTGMREGELLGLRWSDLHLDASKPFLQVEMAVEEADHGYVLNEPKTAHSRRRIALTPTAVGALRFHRVRQNQERLRLGEAWSSSLDLVFPNTIGGLMDPKSLARRDFMRARERAGLPSDLHFHCLRHTCATLLLARGVNPKVVSEMLGHADISITLRVYAHVTEGMQQAAVDTMEQIFGLRKA
jgi:integrase